MDAHALYGLPLERFIPERNALAKELRAGGRRDEAEAVAALRKPSRAAWAVNQLVRTQSNDVAALFEAGDAARRAQSALLAGHGDGAALRDALGQERAGVEQLTAAAQGLLSTVGNELSSSMLERVADTLHAAALEPEAREQVKHGCLDHELRHIGLAEAGLGAKPAPPRGARRKAAAEKPRSGSRSATTLRKRETETRRAADRAARDLRTAEDRAAAASEELTTAKAALAEARHRLREAEAAHRRAQRELNSG